MLKTCVIEKLLVFKNTYMRLDSATLSSESVKTFILYNNYQIYSFMTFCLNVNRVQIR